MRNAALRPSQGSECVTSRYDQMEGRLAKVPFARKDHVFPIHVVFPMSAPTAADQTVGFLYHKCCLQHFFSSLGNDGFILLLCRQLIYLFLFLF
jgi:hypothetical protein